MKLNEKIGKSSIRAIQDDDLEMILQWRNSDHVRNMMKNTKLISMEEHLNWYEKIKKLDPPQQLIYCYNDVPVGLISDTQIGDDPGVTDGGYYLGERGLPVDASFGIVYCSLDYAFEVLGARRIAGEVKKDNETSIFLDKRCGYDIVEKPDGDHLRADFYDAVIDKDGWEKCKEKIRKIL